ncbi:MAG TPA: PIG-L family deacetylase [Oculatellaceae cyanobacterium]
MKQYDLLFLSPHFDDVVLSCAARLIRERKAGRTILIATLFSEADRTEMVSNEVRKKEDNEAMKIFGTDHIWLGFTDAPWRSLSYSNFSKLVSVPAPGDFEFQAAVAAGVRRLWDKIRPAKVFLPLAVGEHIDHRLTYQSRHILQPENCIEFYEDRPYCFLNGIVEARLALAGARIRHAGFHHRLPHDLKVLGQMIRDFENVTIFKNALNNPRVRFFWALEMARRLKNTDVDGPTLESHLITADDDELNTIIAGVAAYRSQIGGLYGDMQNFQNESNEYMRKLNTTAPYTERFWKTIKVSSKK